MRTARKINAEDFLGHNLLAADGNSPVQFTAHFSPRRPSPTLPELTTHFSPCRQSPSSSRGRSSRSPMYSVHDNELRRKSNEIPDKNLSKALEDFTSMIYKAYDLRNSTRVMYSS